MFGKITEFAIEVNRITVVVLVGIVVAGALIFVDYPRQEDPSIQIREAIVVAAFPGMDAYEIEDLITFKIEEKVREIGEVDDIWSISKSGLATVHLELADWVRGKDVETVWKNLRNRMDDLASELPAGTIGPIVNDEFGLTAVATIALWSDGFSLKDMRTVARGARRRLDAVKGVKTIETFGVQQERVFLEVSNAKLARLGIGPDAIIETLRAQNILLPGGVIDANGRNVIVETSGTFNSVEEIASVLIPLPDGDQTIPLKDIVEVRRDYVDPADRPVFFNGRPAIVLSVSILDGVNSVEFGERLTRRLREIEQTLPFGYFLEYATFQPPPGREGGQRRPREPCANAGHRADRGRSFSRSAHRSYRRFLRAPDDHARAHRNVGPRCRASAHVDRDDDHRAGHDGRQRHRRRREHSQPHRAG